VALTVYALITILMWCQMIKQNRIASQSLRESTESFRIDERAWVEVLPMVPHLYYPRTKKNPAISSYDMYLRNTGRTEAHDIQLRIAPGMQGPVGVADQPGIETFTQDRMLFGRAPGTTDIPTVNSVPKELARQETSTVPTLWRGAEPRGKGAGTFVSFLIGRVDYIDAFGVKHWYTFCFYIGDAEGSLQNCKYGNKEDQNPELPPN
jgi:hypothetical protein